MAHLKRVTVSLLMHCHSIEVTCHDHLTEQCGSSYETVTPRFTKLAAKRMQLQHMQHVQRVQRATDLKFETSTASYLYRQV